MILCTGPIESVAEEIMAPMGEVFIAPDSSEAALIPLMETAVALVVRGDSLASAAMIEAAPNLQVVARSGVGYDSVDIAAATARGIPVVYTPGAGARAVAEGAMAMMLYLSKRLYYWDRELKAGNWQSRFNSVTGDLEGATLGIVGLGRIGRILAQLAAPFEMEILAYDPFVEAADGVEMVGLEALFERADFISLHAVATPENRGMIDAAALARIKRGAILVNMARGDLVESLDLLSAALEDGRLGGVGLDVFTPEPPDVSHPIFAAPNCITSPHALGLSRRALYRIFSSMAQDVVAVLKGERPEFVVNPEVLD